MFVYLSAPEILFPVLNMCCESALDAFVSGQSELGPARPTHQPQASPPPGFVHRTLTNIVSPKRMRTRVSAGR